MENVDFKSRLEALELTVASLTKTIDTERISLRGRDGKVRLLLETKSDRTACTFLDAEGEGRLELSVDENGVSTISCKRSGNNIGIVIYTTRTESKISVMGPKVQSCLEVGATESGVSLNSYHGGRIVTKLCLDPDGRPTAIMYKNDHQTVYTYPEGV